MRKDAYMDGHLADQGGLCGVDSSQVHLKGLARRRSAGQLDESKARDNTGDMVEKSTAHNGKINAI